MLNENIAEHFLLLSKLIDIHGDDSFKSKSYSNAAFQIDKLPQQLVEMNPKDWASLRGVGARLVSKIDELIKTETLESLNEYLEKTPEGVIEMLKIKGLGPKKIHTVWKEMEIESIGELLYACNENRLTLYKGFGEKTQINVRDAIIFMMAQEGKFLYQQAEPYVEIYTSQLQRIFGDTLIGITGDIRRNAEIVSHISFLVAASPVDIIQKMKTLGHSSTEPLESEILHFKIENAPSIVIQSCTKERAGSSLMISTGSDDFITYIESKLGKPLSYISFETEEAVFEKLSMPFVLPYHREIATEEKYYKKYIDKIGVHPNNIKGIIHSHSKWSDGSNTLEDMAKAAKEKGLEYLVISDHSQAASYAGGLKPEQIILQHAEIDQLNIQLAPFKIFKSIECDILGNGQLDYDDEILQSFDLIIASVHSSLKMSEEKAMQRLLQAIENPYTLVLGHMTGRLLLSRNGYPLDFKKIIDACAANQVVIELNAHPRRLDIDWRWIPYALEKEVLISINPDAHSISGFDDIRYGCLAAQKALLPAAANLSSFSLSEFEEWLYDTRQIKGTI